MIGTNLLVKYKATIDFEKQKLILKNKQKISTNITCTKLTKPMVKTYDNNENFYECKSTTKTVLLPHEMRELKVYSTYSNVVEYNSKLMIRSNENPNYNIATGITDTMNGIDNVLIHNKTDKKS